MENKIVKILSFGNKEILKTREKVDSNLAPETSNSFTEKLSKTFIRRVNNRCVKYVIR